MAKAVTGFSAMRVGAGVAVLGLLLVGCGGKGGGSTGPSSSSSSSSALKRLEVQVVQGSTRAPGQSMLTRVADLLGWPQVAEASHCTVSGGGVSAATGLDEKAVLVSPTITAAGTLSVTITCSDGAGGTLTLTGLTPGAAVTVQVETRPGNVEVKVRDQQVSPPSVSAPSQPSAPSAPSSSKQGSKSGKGS